MVLSFLAVIVVARWYGKDATGLVALINSSAIVFGTIALFGQGPLLIRELGASDARSNAFSKRRIYQRSLVLVLVLSVLFAFPTIVVLRENFPDPAWRNSPAAISLIASALIGRTLFGLSVNTSRALAPAPVYAAFLIIPMVVNLMIVVIWGSLVNTEALVPSAALVIGVAAAAILAVIYNLRKLYRKSGDELDGLPQKKLAESFPHLLKAGLPFLIASSSTVLLSEGNVIIASIFLPVSDIGVYSVAHRAAYLAAFALSTVTLVAQPKFARLSFERPEEIRRYGRQVALP